LTGVAGRAGRQVGCRPSCLYPANL